MTLFPILVVAVSLIELTNGEVMATWEQKAAFPGGGRHHPITFANTTHGFVVTGSTYVDQYSSDFWAYEAATDTWTDLSDTPSAFPGVGRSFAYGVASTTDCSNSKAYLGFGASATSRLTDFWELDMNTLKWRQLADFPGFGRRHPAMNWIEPMNEIHVGLGDGVGGNYKDWWAYDIASDSWRQLNDFPSTPRHHPFYFAIGRNSYAGLGHSPGAIERDWYRYDSVDESWISEDDFVSYELSTNGVSTTEARVAGTQFAASGSCNGDRRTYGFILSGDGDDHGTMATGEFHFFDPYSSEDGNDDVSRGIWHPLPPHPGYSRWAPGSFVVGSQVYFLGGYDRTLQMLFDDVWMIDLEPLFKELEEDASNNIWIGSGDLLGNDATSTSEETEVPTILSSGGDSSGGDSSSSTTSSAASKVKAHFLIALAVTVASCLC